MVKLNRKTAFEEEEEDPMTGVANLVDAMLVIAVGLLVFLVISWNMQAIVFNDDISPDQRQDAINAMKQVTEIDQGKQLNETPDVSSSSGEGYAELGKVYKDSNTGKLIMIENWLIFYFSYYFFSYSYYFFKFLTLFKSDIFLIFSIFFF